MFLFFGKMKLEMFCLKLCTLVVLFRSVNSAGYIEIGWLPATVEVFEDAAGGKVIHSFSFYTSPSLAAATCAFDTTQPSFDLVLGTGGSQYTVQLASSHSLNYDMLMSHSLGITCSSGAVSAGSTLTVDVIENDAPVFTNIPGSVDVSAKTTKAGMNIFTLSYTDSDSTSPLTHQVIDSITPTEPTAGVTLFSISNDMLVVDYDLIDYDDEAQYEVGIEVADERTTSTVTVTVNIFERNTPPEFVGSIDQTLSLPEFTAGRRLIFDIDSLDAEGDFVQMTLIQSVGASDFELAPATGEFSLLGGSTLDFETTPQYVYTVTIADYIDQQTTSTFTLTINVNDINEQPTFAGTPSAVTIDEAAAGTIVGTLDQFCTDPDGDTLSYSILFSTESPYFSIDPTIAQVTLAVDYDYDDVNLANEVNLTIRCSDPDGLSDDTTYSITIEDINDNSPICSPATTTFSLTYAQAVSETIINVDCSDIDSTINAELDYTILGFSSGYSKTYFQVDTDGNVSISSSFTMDYNTSFYVTVLINDRGVNPGALSATVTLTVTYTEQPTITIYTEKKECFFCTTSAISLVGAAGLVIFMLFILTIVMCVLLCCYRFERQRITIHLAKKKKSSWRWCGCLRPGELKKRKKTKTERMMAERRDVEYFRARNALLGIDDDSEDPSVRQVELPGTSGSTVSKNARRHGRKSMQPGVSSSTGNQNAMFVGRDKTPDISATPVDRKGLTKSQKDQLEKFKQMKKSKFDSDGSSTSNKGQAASGMIWTFEGRS